MTDVAALECPFPGLRSYDPDEDHLYFGRDKQIRSLVRKLRSHSFVAVVGTSGSGKSSLVKCGLVPAMYGGALRTGGEGGRGGGSRWRVATLKPGIDPIRNLTAALADDEVFGRGGESRFSSIASNLRRSSRGIVQTMEEALMPSLGEPAIIDERDNLLVVVDQFEELFRFKSSEGLVGRDPRAEALDFVRLLLRAASNDTLPIFVVITMRSEFIGRCTEFLGLAEEINDAQFLVPRMTRDELRQVIEGPVAVAGGEVDQALVLKLLNEVGDDQDRLPILQHALMRMWRSWEAAGFEGKIGLRHHRDVGGLDNALNRHANEAYDGLRLGADGQELSKEVADERQKIAKRVFQTLTEGGEGEGTRRPQIFATLCAIVGRELEDVASVVDAFRDEAYSFLVPGKREKEALDDPQDPALIDISHESLMRVWMKLRAWVAEETDRARVYRRLIEDARTGDLLVDSRLATARDVLEGQGLTADWAHLYSEGPEDYEAARAHLAASREREEGEVERRAAEAAERERLEDEARQAEEEGRAARRRTRVAITIVIGLFVGVVVSGWATVRASREKKTAVAAQDAATAARDRADARADTARVALTAASDSARAAQRAMFAAVEAQAEADRLLGIAEADAADAEELASMAEREAQYALAAQREARLQRDTAQAERAEAEAQMLIAAAQRDSALTRNRVAAAGRLASFAGDSALAGWLSVMAYDINASVGGNPFEASIFDGLSRANDALSGGGLPPEVVDDDVVRTLDVGSDLLVWGSDDGSTSVLRGSDGQTWELSGFGRSVTAVAVRDDDQYVAEGDLSGVVRLWNVSDPARPVEAPRMNDDGPVVGLRFVQDSLLAVLHSGALRVCPLDGLDRCEPSPLPSDFAQGFGSFSLVALASDGWNVAALGEGALIVWEGVRPGAPPVVLRLHQGSGSAVDMAGDMVAVATPDHSIVLWDDWREAGADYAGSPTDQLLLGHTARITSLAFGPSEEGGRPSLLASSSLDGTVRLWSLDYPDASPVVLRDHSGWVWSVAFDRTGERVYSGGEDLMMRVREIQPDSLRSAICGLPIRPPSADEERRYLAAFDSTLKSTVIREGPCR